MTPLESLTEAILELMKSTLTRAEARRIAARYLATKGAN